MSTRVYLLRHAESANPHVFHGAESDVGLSERGRRQAQEVAGFLAALQPAGLVSSAMRRALETATPIATVCGLTVEQEPQLHERKVGGLSGQPFGSHEGVWSETLCRWAAGEMDFASPGAESYAAIQARVLPVWHQIAPNYKDRSVVVVAHGVVIKVLLTSLLPDLPISRWRQMGPIQNTAITELAGVEGEWRMLRFNELGHQESAESVQEPPRNL